MKTALALGTFDGVHPGHRAVLDLPDGYKKIAVVFSVPPKSVISGEPLAIMTSEDKTKALKRIGMDKVCSLEFRDVRDMTPEDFLLFLKKRFSPLFISCGFNYRFGKNAEGDTALLRDFCLKNKIELKVNEPVMKNGVAVSSTEIRELLKNGEIQKANALLAEPFSFSASVIRGDERGRTLGFPTANQKYPKSLIPVKFGVYKTAVIIGEKKYNGITDIGIRPTFRTDYIISETFIKDFRGNLYGRKITVQLLEFLRGEKKFSSAEELKRQIQSDIRSAGI